MNSKKKILFVDTPRNADEKNKIWHQMLSDNETFFLKCFQKFYIKWIKSEELKNTSNFQ